MGIPLIQTAMACCVGIATAFSVPPAGLRLHAATTAPPRRVPRTVCRPTPARGRGVAESAWRGADTALHCTGRACGPVYGGFHGQAECARRRLLAAGRACARSLPGMLEASAHARTHLCARLASAPILPSSDKTRGDGCAQAKAAEDPAKLVAAALKRINSVPYEKTPNFVPVPFAGPRAYTCARALTHPLTHSLSRNLQCKNRMATHSQMLAHTHAHTQRTKLCNNNTQLSPKP